MANYMLVIHLHGHGDYGSISNEYDNSKEAVEEFMRVRREWRRLQEHGAEWDSIDFSGETADLSDIREIVLYTKMTEVNMPEKEAARIEVEVDVDEQVEEGNGQNGDTGRDSEDREHTT